MSKTQMQALPDNSKVRAKLLGDWSTHLHKRSEDIGQYQAFKYPSELEANVYQRQNVLFRC